MQGKNMDSSHGEIKNEVYSGWHLISFILIMSLGLVIKLAFLRSKNSIRFFISSKNPPRFFISCWVSKKCLTFWLRFGILAMHRNFHYFLV